MQVDHKTAVIALLLRAIVVSIRIDINIRLSGSNYGRVGFCLVIRIAIAIAVAVAVLHTCGCPHKKSNAQGCCQEQSGPRFKSVSFHASFPLSNSGSHS
ncbi:hypothetical protein PAECIP111893_03565 [Paenibacillus plantiphilus]|uniref:Secreted protein n=1 Tax=Paenibacillus plantiphilus TaxID=2905650 RepID=A0ABM9CGY8_9BACL|nr:hypothetical protein PAECIP111893_03565 [Paenibacillus plantiphilus]